MKKILFILFVFLSATASAQMNYTLTWQNALTWGIKPTNSEATNTTNATAAINYLIARGGGTLYFPFADSAYKVRIEIPYININSAWLPIQLLGASPPSMVAGTLGALTLPGSGVILKSSDTTTGNSVIKVLTSGSAFSGLDLYIKNLDVRTYNKPKIGGIDAGYAAQVEFENVFVNTNIYSVQAGDPSTVRQTSGIIMPVINNGAECNLNNVWVSGYFNGIVANELTSGHNVNLFSCWNGVVIPANYHAAHFDKLGLYRCRYGIKGTGANSWVYIDLIDTEHPAVSQVVDSTEWQTSVYDINDSLNLIHGFATYHNVVGLTGVVQSAFVKNGGTNLFTYSVDSTDFFGRRRNNTLTGVNYFTNNTTYAGTNQHNGYEKFYGNLLANKIGIGDSSFTDLLAIKGAADVGQRIETTSASNEAYTNYYADGNIANIEAFGASHPTTAVRNSLAFVSKVNNNGALNFFTTTGGSLLNRLKINNSGTVTIGAYTLPATDGSSGNALVTNGSGTVSWGSVGAAGSTGQIQYNSSGAFAGSSNLFWDNSNVRLGIGTSSPSYDGIHVLKNATFVSALVETSSASGEAAIWAKTTAGYGALEVFGPSSGTLPNTAIFTASAGLTSGLGFVTLANAPITFATNGTTADVTVSGAGAVRFHTYGAGTATFDASGNITSTSDRRVKNSINPYRIGLKAIMDVHPSTYKRNSTGDYLYAGFIAQDIQKAFGGLGVGKNEDGMLTLDRDVILAGLVNAIQEQQQQIEELKREIKKLKK